MADGRPKLFRKPLANTTLMFFGMALLLPLIPLVDWLQAKLQQRRERQRWRGGASTVPASDATQRGSVDEPLLPPAAPLRGQQRPLAAADWLRQCGLLIVPTLLDVACTATHKIGERAANLSGLVTACLSHCMISPALAWISTHTVLLSSCFPCRPHVSGCVGLPDVAWI
jgi:hypothetical protein